MVSTLLLHARRIKADRGAVQLYQTEGPELPPWGDSPDSNVASSVVPGASMWSPLSGSALAKLSLAGAALAAAGTANASAVERKIAQKPLRPTPLLRGPHRFITVKRIADNAVTGTCLLDRERVAAAQSRGRTRIFKPPFGERVGIWRIVIVRPGIASRRSCCSSIVATSFTSVWPNRFPMQILLPPPKGT